MTGRVYGHLIRRSAIASLSITADEWEASVDTQGKRGEHHPILCPIRIEIQKLHA